jgi:hypothetical protein
MKSSVLGKFSFYLALSPWVFGLMQMLQVPGFGWGTLLGILGGFLVVFGPPVIFGVAFLVRFRDKSIWSKAGFVISFITLVLWLVAVVCGGFSWGGRSVTSHCRKIPILSGLLFYIYKYLLYSDISTYPAKIKAVLAGKTLTFPSGFYTI